MHFTGSGKHLFCSEVALDIENTKKRRYWQMSVQSVAGWSTRSGGNGVMRNVANEEWLREFGCLS